MLIHIDGWFAGGKSILWSLLDGHKDVYVSPLHDYTFAMFLKDDFHHWLKAKNLLFFRNSLSTTSYYKFEQIFKYGSLDVALSANETMKIPYNIDFYKLDKSFISKLEALKVWSPETIIESLYQTLYELNEQQGNPQHFAFMGNAYRYKSYYNIPKLFPNMKTIIIKREIKNIIASRTNRKSRPIDVKEYQAFAPDFEHLINSGEVNRISDYFAHMQRLQSQYPEKFLIIDFEDLVYKTQETMQVVANYLSIEYNKILQVPTRDGILLEQNGITLISNENDNAEQLLTPKEIQTIENGIAHYNKNTYDIKELNLLNNTSLASHLRLLHIDLENIKHNYKNIVLYGNDHICQLSIEKLQEQVTSVIHFNNQVSNIQSLQVFHPRDLLNVEYDCLLITALGQENEIIEELKVLPNIDAKKIKVFNI